MKKIIFLSLILFSSMIIAQTHSYYINGEQVQLTVNKKIVNIITSNAFDETQLNTFNFHDYTLVNEKETRNGEYKKIAKLEFTNAPSTQLDYDQKIADLKNFNGVEGVYPFYTHNGYDIGVSNFFAVKIKQNTSYTQLETIANQKNVTIIEQMQCMPQWYILSTNANTIENILDLCSNFYETGVLEEAEPLFTDNIIIPTAVSDNETITVESLDTCYDEGGVEDLQWNLFNNPNHPLADINICGAWEVTKGAGATVAVLDTGVASQTADLPALSNDVIPTSGSYDGNYYYDYGGQKEHGSYTAGIVGALHNNQDAGGIAPESNILFIANELAITFSQLEIADAICDLPTLYPEVSVLNMSFNLSST